MEVKFSLYFESVQYLVDLSSRLNPGLVLQLTSAKQRLEFNAVTFPVDSDGLLPQGKVTMRQFGKQA